jgi:hypothetical protein
LNVCYASMFVFSADSVCSFKGLFQGVWACQVANRTTVNGARELKKKRKKRKKVSNHSIR